jgi:hypothetical protein
MNDDESGPWQFLRAALTMLAADAGEQAAWIDRHRVCVDELALDFEAANVHVPLLASSGRIDPPAALRIARLDAMLAAMSGPHNAGRWTTEALATDPGWACVRRMARQVLTDLEQDGDRP